MFRIKNGIYQHSFISEQNTKNTNTVHNLVLHKKQDRKSPAIKPMHFAHYDHSNKPNNILEIKKLSTLKENEVVYVVDSMKTSFEIHEIYPEETHYEYSLDQYIANPLLDK